MAGVLFIDSAAHYLAGHKFRKWTTPGNVFISPTGGPSGNPCIVGNTGALTKTFPSEQVTLTFGDRFKFTSLRGDLFYAYNVLFGGFGTGNTFLSHVGDGRLQVILAFASTGHGIVADFVAVLGVWYFIEFKITMSRNGNRGMRVDWEVHINEETVDSGFLDDTAGSAQIPADTYYASVARGDMDGYLSDYYITDGEFLGDTSCRAFFPRVDATYTAGVPSSAGAHYLMVKEHDSDDDSTVIDLAAISDKDSYLMDTISAFTSVKALQALWCAKKTASGPASFKGLLRSAGTDVKTREFFPGFSEYAYYSACYRKSPFTAADFTIAEINAMEVGQERIS